MRALACTLGFALSACVLFRAPDRTPEIAPAVADLAAAGYAFAADVRFRHDAWTPCDGLTCADLELESNRRVIRVADGAFRSPAKLRASLLEIWPRYTLPHRGDVSALARAALLVAREGPRAGISDPGVLGEARFVYRQLWLQMSEADRVGLPEPDALAPR